LVRLRATATFARRGPTGEGLPAELIHTVELATLSDEFADVLTVEQVIARLDEAVDRDVLSDTSG
jgi:hypothetical protein